MTIINIIYIVILIFGVLQIILFFKLWGMTNDVKEFKNLYSEKSRELSSCIDKLNYALKNMNQSDNKTKDSKIEISYMEKKDENIREKATPIAKQLPVIDENSNEFKQRLRKWIILNDKGYTEQAINEYMEYTGRTKEDAIEFMKSI